MGTRSASGSQIVWKVWKLGRPQENRRVQRDGPRRELYEELFNFSLHLGADQVSQFGSYETDRTRSTVHPLLTILQCNCMKWKWPVCHHTLSYHDIIDISGKNVSFFSLLSTTSTDN